MVSFYLKIQNKFFFFLCLGSCQEQMAAFFEDNTMPAVAQVEADLKDYNYKYGSIDWFGAIVAVDLACEILTA